jgi:hypothetical protein
MDRRIGDADSLAVRRCCLPRDAQDVSLVRHSTRDGRAPAHAPRLHARFSSSINNVDVINDPSTKANPFVSSQVVGDSRRRRRQRRRHRMCLLLDGREPIDKQRTMKGSWRTKQFVSCRSQSKEGASVTFGGTTTVTSRLGLAFLENIGSRRCFGRCSEVGRFVGIECGRV